MKTKLLVISSYVLMFGAFAWLQFELRGVRNLIEMQRRTIETQHQTIAQLQGPRIFLICPEGRICIHHTTCLTPEELQVMHSNRLAAPSVFPVCEESR